MKSLLIGILLGVLLVMGGAYYYFASGMAPAASSDPPMPFEKKMANLSLSVHIDKANIPSPPIPADEANLLAAAKQYEDQCAGCHGLPNQPPPTIANNMYPHATLLFKGKGVTDDPPQESYWKITNGIRLTGMPSFKDPLTDTQRWQLAQLVAHGNDVPDSVKRALLPEPPPVAMAPVTPAPAKMPGSKR